MIEYTTLCPPPDSVTDRLALAPEGVDTTTLQVGACGCPAVLQFTVLWGLELRLYARVPARQSLNPTAKSLNPKT